MAADWSARRFLTVGVTAGKAKYLKPEGVGHDVRLISVYDYTVGNSVMRSLLVLLAALAMSVEGTSAIAQSRFRAFRPGLHHDRLEHSHRHATPYRGGRSFRSGSTLFGFSFGTLPYGYDYAGYPDPYFLYPYSLDPWARGSFREPDLLDDPYFYDRVPPVNRYRRPHASRRLPHRSGRPPLELRSSSGSPTGSFPNFDTIDAGPSIVQRDRGMSSNRGMVLGGQPDAGDRGFENGMKAIELLQQANETLLLNLARYDGGDAWIEFLGCQRMIADAVESDMQQLRRWMSRFDGVAADAAMQSVASIDGFDQTRSALRQYLRQPIQSVDLIDPSPAVESLPAPEPDLPRDAVLEGASEV